MATSFKQAHLPPEAQMTVEEFLAFTESRPHEERWELIEGLAIMNPSPTSWHQQITGNLYAGLLAVRGQRQAPWMPLLGIGTRVPVSPNSLPQPVLLVLPGLVPDEPSHFTDEALVPFEILSRSNTRSDQTWRRRVYASIPSCLHYVTVSQMNVGVTRYDRADGWKGASVKSLDDTLVMEGFGAGVEVQLRDIYRFTPLG